MGKIDTFLSDSSQLENRPDLVMFLLKLTEMENNLSSLSSSLLASWWDAGNTRNRLVKESINFGFSMDY